MFHGILKAMSLLQLVKLLEKSQWEKPNFVIPDKPILSRYNLQTMQAPKGDFETRSSGTTGIPVIIQKSYLSRLWWMATNLRATIWAKRDVRLTMAEIKANCKKETRPSWGDVYQILSMIDYPLVGPINQPTGPSYLHPIDGDLNAWLEQIQPHYLFIYPSALDTLNLSKLTQLRGIGTTGETLYQQHPLVTDLYSSEEVGTIAIQCPDNSDFYHVMENIIVEILDDMDQPADVGRVVVTDLVSPYMHRYDIGDYAERGFCDCGRGLPSIKKILGRRRNRIIMPDGSRRWPRVGSLSFRQIAPIRRYQIIQKSISELVLKLEVEKLLTPEQENALKSLMLSKLEFPFTIELVYVEKFPPGKFEDFICEIPQQGQI
jgi:phenylacetate-CoA ligase